MRNLPIIAVTMGDPAGVGPEICLRLLADEELCAICRPVIFGDAAVLKACAKATGAPLSAAIIPPSAWPAAVNGPAVLDLAAIRLEDFTPGTINAATGRA